MKKILSLLLAIALLSSCDKGYKEYETSQTEELEAVIVEEPPISEETPVTDEPPIFEETPVTAETTITEEVAPFEETPAISEPPTLPAETSSFPFIYDELEALSVEYPPPMGVREDLIDLCRDFDYNNDGVNDYIVAYSIYMQFIFVIFDGVTHEIIFEEHVGMLFLPELTQMNIYANEQNEMLFCFLKRYQEVAASTAKVETIQIVNENISEIFEAVYSLDDEFIHAYGDFEDGYPNEEEYTNAYSKLLEGYALIGALEFERLEIMAGE